MIDFSSHWTECPVGALGSPVRGLAFRPQDAKEAPGPELIACFRTSNIQQKLEEHDVLFIPRSLLRSERQLLQEGDLLISTANSDNLVGKCVIVEKLSYEATLGGFISAFRVNSSLVIPRYFYHWLSSPIIQARMRSLARRTTNIANLAMSDFIKVKIPLPPLSEQQRIVEILHEADEVSRLRDKAEAKTAELIPAMFYDHFVGEHVHDFQPLHKLAKVVSGVAIGRKSRGMTVEVPYLRVANVQAGFIDLSEVKSTSATDEEVIQFGLKSGDVLLTEGGDFDKLGRGCLWEGQVEPCIHQNHVFRVRPIPGKLNSHFFAHYLQSAKAKHYFLRCAKKTTNLASINLTQLKALPVPNISIEDQERFELQIQAASECSLGGDNTFLTLIGSLTAHAFSGLLTTDWREANKDKLTSEASKRDALLKEAGATLSRTRLTRELLQDRTDGIYADLNREQRDLLREIQRTFGGVDYGRYFTAEQLAADIKGALHRNPQRIESHLALFAARGLIIPVSQLRDYNTGPAFAACYRLPIAEKQAPNDESDVDVIDSDDIRGALMEAQRKLATGRT